VLPRVVRAPFRVRYGDAADAPANAFITTRASAFLCNIRDNNNVTRPQRMAPWRLGAPLSDCGMAAVAGRVTYGASSTRRCAGGYVPLPRRLFRAAQLSSFSRTLTVRRATFPGVFTAPRAGDGVFFPSAPCVVFCERASVPMRGADYGVASRTRHIGVAIARW